MADLTIGRIPKAIGATQVGDSQITDNGAGGIRVAGPLVLGGATSGGVTLQVPAIAGASIITFPVGTTNFPATGGPGQVLQQATLGGPITVGALPAGSIGGLGAGVAAWLATPSSANLRTAVTDETGTGALVFADTPTLVTPVLSGNSSCTGNFNTSGIYQIGGINVVASASNNVTIGAASNLAVISAARLVSTVGVSFGTATADYTNDFTGAFTRITYATQTRPASNAGGGTLFGWNFSNGLAENDLWNPFEGLTGGFSFKQKTAANTHTDLAFLTSTGLIIGDHGAQTPIAKLQVLGPSATARIYNAYADAANGEWAYLGDWSGNVARYGTDKNGTGVVRDVNVLRGGVTQVSFGSAGATYSVALIQRPAASVTPANNGDLMVQATSNTALAFKLKGSDGTVRTGTITLS